MWGQLASFPVPRPAFPHYTASDESWCETGNKLGSTVANADPNIDSNIETAAAGTN